MPTTQITEAETMHRIAGEMFRQSLTVMARATLVEIAETAKALSPDARFVGLTTSDQSFDGDQWVVGCWRDDGTAVAEDGDPFQEIGMDICDRNESQWNPHAHIPVTVLDAIESVHAEQYLDLDEILAADFDEPLMYRVVTALAACPLTDEIPSEDQPEDDTSTLDHFIELARQAITTTPG